jgi:phosphoglycerol transferase
MPMDGTNLTIVIRSFVDIVINPLAITTMLMTAGTLRIYKGNRPLIKKRIHYDRRIFQAASGILLGTSAVFIIFKSDIFSFIQKQFERPSSFYEEHYIDPEKITFAFPEKKRNLIVIFIESLETGFLSVDQGGLFSETLISETALLAQDNINFSHTDGIGGGSQTYGTGWTAAGIVSTYTGIPLAPPLGNDMERFAYFLPNITGIGDILYKNGYDNYFILGSDSKFAGRDKYFKTHGNTTVWDYVYFHDEGFIDKDYYVWWGFEDRKLYDFAKMKLSEINRNAAPFFFTLLTVDTHFTDGYLDAFAERKYASRYKNVLSDMSKQLFDFISWIRQQDFYDNTTIAVFGDHLYMDSAVFPHRQKSEDRRPLNIFINSTLNNEHTKNREFTHFDLFPTLIDAIGIEYNADGIGLGRSMHKGEKTLIELLGKEQFETNLAMKSVRYNSFFY